MRNPVGPLPSSIYWRRRAVAGLLVALLAVLIAWAVTSGGGGGGGRDDAKPGAWRRLTSGLANHGPRRLDAVWLVFDGREPAEYRLQLDNVIVRRADGSTVPLYVDGAPAGKVPAETPGYSGVSIRTVTATAAR